MFRKYVETITICTSRKLIFAMRDGSETEIEKPGKTALFTVLRVERKKGL